MDGARYARRRLKRRSISKTQGDRRRKRCRRRRKRRKESRKMRKRRRRKRRRRKEEEKKKEEEKGGEGRKENRNPVPSNATSKIPVISIFGVRRLA